MLKLLICGALQRKENKMDKNYWMNEGEYNLVTKKTPIPTIDLVVLRNGYNTLETLLLIRKTGYEAGKWCIIGGRQWNTSS